MIVDMAGFGTLPNPAVLYNFFHDIAARANRGENYKVWVTLKGEKPGALLSPDAKELLVALVQAGGLHCLQNEETSNRPKSTFGQISTCVSTGMVLLEADGSVDVKYIDALKAKYMPVTIMGIPSFLIRPPTEEPPINGHIVQPLPLKNLRRLRVAREDVN